jgi:surface protein
MYVDGTKLSENVDTYTFDKTGNHTVKVILNDTFNTAMYMFYECYNITSFNFDNFDTSNVESMYGMFESCKNLTKLDVSSFDTSNVQTMVRMFYGCSSLTKLDGLSSFDTSEVANMSEMFSSSQKLTELDLSSFDTSNVKNMSSMFSTCTNLTELDLTSFNTLNTTNISWMFSSCRNIKSIKMNGGLHPNVSFSYMLYGAGTSVKLDDGDKCKFYYSNGNYSIIIGDYSSSNWSSKIWEAVDLTPTTVDE